MDLCVWILPRVSHVCLSSVRNNKFLGNCTERGGEATAEGATGSAVGTGTFALREAIAVLLWMESMVEASANVQVTYSVPQLLLAATCIHPHFQETA